MNLANIPQNAPPQPIQNINTNFIRGQFHAGARNLQTQLLTGNYLQHLQSQGQFGSSQQATVPSFSSSGVDPTSSSIVTFPQNQSPQQQQQQQPLSDGAFSFQSTFTGFTSQPANIEIINEADLPNLRFKRQNKEASATDDEKKSKRDLVELNDGTFIDDKFFDTNWYDGLAQFGGNEVKNSLTKHDNLEDEIREHDREPAEGEVEAVRMYCNSCLVEPFDSALVLHWKSASTSAGVLRARASKVCGDF